MVPCADGNEDELVERRERNLCRCIEMDEELRGLRRDLRRLVERGADSSIVADATSRLRALAGRRSRRAAAAHLRVE